MSQKINPTHLERKALLYIRQSSTYQVRHNTEGQNLQYAMKERLIQLGWKTVDVIDEDLGRSASGSVDRPGFQRLVTEVSLGRVGAVAAREVSRFARNSRDWQQLVEVCRMVDTLLVDQETIYDPRRSNDDCSWASKEASMNMNWTYFASEHMKPDATKLQEANCSRLLRLVL